MGSVETQAVTGGCLSKIVVFSLAIYCFLIAWDLDLSAWLASAGIMGIAVGFAAKDTLANLFGGLFVIMDAPYKIGDFINLDSGEPCTRCARRPARCASRSARWISTCGASPPATSCWQCSPRARGSPSTRSRSTRTALCSTTSQW